MYSILSVTYLTPSLLFQSAMTALKECVRVLSYEPEVQPEGQLGLEAKDEMKQLEEWIKDEGWKY